LEIYSKNALEVHSRYAAMAGSEQVALLFSIQELIKHLDQTSPRKVLELGGGIGTLTECLLRFSKSDLTVVENNEFCLNKMKKNLESFRHFNLVTTYENLAPYSDFDMLIIDVNNGIFNVKSLLFSAKNVSVIFIEGHHLAHRLNICRTMLEKNFIQEFEDLRPKRGIKGCGFFYVRPDRSFCHWKAKQSFLLTYTPFFVSKFMIRIRYRTGSFLDSISFVPGLSKLRRLWFGKIPWNF
jgi:hypothetical protein